MLAKGMGVPMGDMKGVLDSEAEPKVAALDMSDPPLGCCCLPLPRQENNVKNNGQLVNTLKPTSRQQMKRQGTAAAVS